MNRIISVVLLFVSINALYAQSASDSLTQRQKVLRKSLLVGTIGGYTVGSLILLDQLWYKQYATTCFHFYNDNSQWCQMDKCGHAFSTYTSAMLILKTIEWAGFEVSSTSPNLTHLTSGAMKWAGFTRKQSIIVGELYGLLYLTSIEVLDGFSAGWGFSWGDELANVGGGLLFSTQQYYWKEQRLRLKFSYHPTTYAADRPNILGSNAAESLIKDYNGQTYWLSVNPSSFLKKDTKFPKWLNISFGYGATGMVSGKSNQIINYAANTNLQGPNGNTISFGPSGSQTSEIINKDGSIEYFTRYREYYLSLDLDMTKIKTKSKFLKGVFTVFNCFKIPFPTVEWNRPHGFSFHPLFF